MCCCCLSAQARTARKHSPGSLLESPSASGIGPHLNVSLIKNGSAGLWRAALSLRLYT